MPNSLPKSLPQAQPAPAREAPPSVSSAPRASDAGARRDESEFSSPEGSRAPSDEGLGGVDRDALQRLVQRAVAETLHPSASNAPRSEVVLAASARLESLLKTFGDIEALRQRLSEQREALMAEVSRLRSAVVARRGFLEGEGDTSVWPVDPERWRTLRWRVQARIAALLDSSPTPSQGAARVAAQELLELFVAERALSLSELRRRSDAELVQLERRLTALSANVEQAEQVLELMREAPLEGRGISSYFREHEGLSPDAKLREIKLAMLEGVFRENRDLQRPGSS